jgi:hypothetical protein
MNRIIWKKNSSTPTRHAATEPLPWPKRPGRIKLDACDTSLKASTFGKYEPLQHCRQWAVVWEQLWGKRPERLRLRKSSGATQQQPEGTQPSFRHPTFGKYDLAWYHNGYAFAALGLCCGILAVWWLYITYVGVALLQGE